MWCEARGRKECSERLDYAQNTRFYYMHVFVIHRNEYLINPLQLVSYVYLQVGTHVEAL